MKSKPEILIVSEDFPPNAGGIAQWAFGIANGLYAMGKQVAVITRYFERLGKKTDLPYPVEYVYGNTWKQLRTWYWWKALRSYLLHNPTPKYIIASTWNCSRALIKLKKRYGFHLITVVHGLEITRPMNFIKFQFALATFRASDLIFCVSNFTSESLKQKIKLGVDKIRILPNGVDFHRFKALSENPLYEKYPKHDNLNLVTISRVIERKGHDLVIRALPQVLLQIPQLKYYIVGPWHEDFYQHLQKLISELKLDGHVIFSGLIDGSDLVNYYNLADVYIMVSKLLEDKGDSEGFGITFLEANACEVPVIGSRSGGIVDAIEDGITGLLIEANNIPAISEAIITLMSNPALRSKYGKQGRQRVIDHLNWDALSIRMYTELSQLDRPPSKERCQ